MDSVNDTLKCPPIDAEFCPDIDGINDQIVREAVCFFASLLSRIAILN